MKCKLLFLFGFLCSLCYGQRQQFNAQDSLRGSITPERIWWDLKYYDLKVQVNPERKFISGSNTIRYKVLEEGQVMQIDLQPPMVIDTVLQDGIRLEIKDAGNAHFVTLGQSQSKDSINEITIYFSGHPKEAVRAPWDGGFSWSKDSNGQPFIATSCQGLGASVWWPNKDHMYDEVDSMALAITVPKNLQGIGNGRLRNVSDNATSKTFEWFVGNPINNYGVNVNIGDYAHIHETYPGEKGTLDLDYYVLKENQDKAKEQFKQTPMMLEAFEHWFGPYPFYSDSFKLVEVPYLGMEHQSSITYGNGYGNGYLGTDLSGSGWGMRFDYILVHESGHEWFANNITYKDIADMWIHESFTTYSESLFLDYHFGKGAASAYMIGAKNNIRNDAPIIGPYGVNQEGSGDMYYKGANMLHTLRQLLEDDEKWRTILRGLNKEFYHKTVTTQEIENYISVHSGIDLSAFFNQYLRTANIPTLEIRKEKKGCSYRYSGIVPEFDMPVRVLLDGKPHWLYPTSEWKTEVLPGDLSTLEADPNFLIHMKKSRN